jgi:hypothetical protein
MEDRNQSQVHTHVTQYGTGSEGTTYYIGDLCYAMADAWDEVCELLFIGDEEQTGRLRLKDGREFFIFGTAHGDGEYKDQFGNTYGVDTGTLGAIRVEDIRSGKYTKETLIELGCLHTFDQPLSDAECCSVDGVVTFGHIRIDTDPLQDDEEDYLDEDWYGDEDDEDED